MKGKRLSVGMDDNVLVPQCQGDTHVSIRVEAQKGWSIVSIDPEGSESTQEIIERRLAPLLLKDLPFRYGQNGKSPFIGQVLDIEIVLDLIGRLEKGGN